MCVPGCQSSIRDRLSRRHLLTGAAATAATAMVAAPRAPAFAQAPRSFTRVIDLTHTMPHDFPTFAGVPGIEIEDVLHIATDGYNLKRWRIEEHTGTHLDAPIHFSTDGQMAHEIPIENLVVPVVVVDIAARAEDDADTELTPDDIKSWIAEHGDLPDGCCVAMNSGWDRHVTTDRFRNADADGGMHFPGFHPEAAQMLMEEANVVGIAVDTLSLDHGASTTFGTHFGWLPTNRWGMEAVANLGELPATGATLVVGAPKIEGVTGGITRIIALV